MTIRIHLLTLGLLGMSHAAMAQDQHFTQFYASPQLLNPGLTGAFEGRYRVSAIYRDQWRNVLDNPIRTFAVAGDLRFDPPFSRFSQDAVGLGLMFFTDQVSVLDFSTNQIALTLAYHKALDVDGRQYLTLGLQGGLTQRNINYAYLSFSDQFDGFTGFVLPTGEQFPENNFAYADLNVGLTYVGRFGRAGALFAGTAIHHIVEPRATFYNQGIPGDRFYKKISAQLAANIPLGASRTALLPRFLFALQGAHAQVNAGTNVRFPVGRYGTSAVQLGSWVRPVRGVNGFDLDAVVALVGFEVNNVLFGISYDINPQALSFGRRQGALELSVAYLGEYENEQILCPKF
ncbi:MAG: PorP/SprF family type IX secretion system membrane protein [Saprospiraceae bacterium]|nr:PorP/SprF family type IX secretion system membrane protein [Saprospiraceae bacterium]MDW8483220.1 PorP/SprF family type IX secretion system membrane protein [Saprospiraceae bacterium]